MKNLSIKCVPLTQNVNQPVKSWTFPSGTVDQSMENGKATRGKPNADRILMKGMSYFDVVGVLLQ
jgi:hypothetical protein